MLLLLSLIVGCLPGNGNDGQFVVAMFITTLRLAWGTGEHFLGKDATGRVCKYFGYVIQSFCRTPIHFTKPSCCRVQALDGAICTFLAKMRLGDWLGESANIYLYLFTKPSCPIPSGLQRVSTATGTGISLSPTNSNESSLLLTIYLPSAATSD